MGFYLFGVLFTLNIICIFLCYGMVYFLPRTMASNAITWFSLLCLLAVQFNHYYYNEAKESGLEVDLIFMLNLARIHMFAVNYDNAGKLDDPEASKLFTTRERYYAETLRQKVSFADWINYFFFAATCPTGMVHEYRTFDEFINLKGDFKEIPQDKLTMPALKRFGQMVFVVVLMILVSLNFSFDYLLTPEWSALPFWQRAGYLVGAIHFKVYILFIGFVSMECNFIACGQGYTPSGINKDKTFKEENFNSIRQIVMLPVENQISWHEAVVSWNISVHHWLKYYIMLRLLDRTKPKGQMQVGPMAATFILSAAWHGCQLGFFLMFIGFSMMEYICKLG